MNSYLSARGRKPEMKAGGLSGDHNLTKREKQILGMIYRGDSNKDIANQLGKSIRTVETHRFNIMKKLDVSNIAELLRAVDQDLHLKEQLEI